MAGSPNHSLRYTTTVTRTVLLNHLRKKSIPGSRLPWTTSRHGGTRSIDRSIPFPHSIDEYGIVAETIQHRIRQQDQQLPRYFVSLSAVLFSSPRTRTPVIVSATAADSSTHTRSLHPFSPCLCCPIHALRNDRQHTAQSKPSYIYGSQWSQQRTTAVFSLSSTACGSDAAARLQEYHLKNH